MTTATAKKQARKDEFGLRTDTKTHTAARMFKRGATMSDVKKKTGSAHYNVLKWLERRGHQVTKDKDTGIITVIPKPKSS